MASWTFAQICLVLFLYLVGVRTRVAAHRQLFIIIKRSSTLTLSQIAFIVQNLKREFHDLTKQDQGNLKPTLVAYIFYGSLDLKRHTKRKRVWRGVGIICPAIVIELSTQSFQHNTFIRGSKLLAPVGYFADPVCTSLQAVWAEQHAEFT